MYFFFIHIWMYMNMEMISWIKLLCVWWNGSEYTSYILHTGMFVFSYIKIAGIYYYRKVCEKTT